ncbi:MAG: hypothetical protein QW463_01220 [Candidatus Caldarchaeum sp.]
MRDPDEERLLESLTRIESYKPVFSTYSGYENRVLPGTITALGEIDVEKTKSLPGKNVLLVGVPNRFFMEQWNGFRESASFILMSPLEGQGFDLWVIAVPMHRLRRLTWIVFPITESDLEEIEKEPKFSVILVPVEKQDFEELTNRAEDVLEALGQGEPFPSENGIILIVDLTEVFGTGEG